MAKKPTNKVAPKSTITEGSKRGYGGGPAGANQGGSPRGAARLDPSHVHMSSKQDRAGHDKGGKKRIVNKKK